MSCQGFEIILKLMRHRYIHIRIAVTTIVLTMVLLGLSTGTNAGKLYKWIDENGNVRYSDRLPPTQVRQAHEILNAQGVVISKTDAAKTEEELIIARKIQEDLEARLADEKRIKAKQFHEDQVLLLTFSSEEEMDRVRDNRLNVLDAVIELIKKSLATTTEKLIGLEDTAEKLYISKAKEIPGGLAQNIEFFTRKKEIREQQLDLKETEKRKILRQYRIDLARFRYLIAVRGY